MTQKKLAQQLLQFLTDAKGIKWHTTKKTMYQKKATRTILGKKTK